MNTKQIFYKIIGFPNTVYNALILRYRHVKHGRNLKINGHIHCVSNTADGIVIGNDVSINSNLGSNPIGGDTRTILFAKDKGKIRIGDGCGISNVTLFACDSITLGNQVLIGGGTKIYDTDFHWLDFEKRISEPGGVTSPVVIKGGAFIGAHCIILKGVTIGERSIIGAGSVVTKDIPGGEIWAGNPAKFIRKISDSVFAHDYVEELLFTSSLKAEKYLIKWRYCTMRKISDRAKQFIHRYKNRKLCIFDGNVIIDSHDTFEGGNRITSGVTLLNSSMGYGSYIGDRSFIKNTKIGRYACIATDVSIIVGRHPTHTFVSIHPAFYSNRKQSGFTYVNHEKFREFKYIDNDKRYTVEIGNDVWVGSYVKIMEGIHIGDGAIIAAGAIVTKDVPPYAIVGGVPARVIGYRFDEEQIVALKELKWWDKGEEWIKENAEKFEDISILLGENPLNSRGGIG